MKRIFSKWISLILIKKISWVSFKALYNLKITISMRRSRRYYKIRRINSRVKISYTVLLWLGFIIKSEHRSSLSIQRMSSLKTFWILFPIMRYQISHIYKQMILCISIWIIDIMMKWISNERKTDQIIYMEYLVLGKLIRIRRCKHRIRIFPGIRCRRAFVFWLTQNTLTSFSKNELIFFQIIHWYLLT